MLNATELKALVEEKSTPSQVTCDSSVRGCGAACFSSERKGTAGEEVDPRWKPCQLFFARVFLCFGSRAPFSSFFFAFLLCAHPPVEGRAPSPHTPKRAAALQR
ncbi:hypothetical protein TraAM80_10335 [Trypanosoma rangeli]|uniref:Uncharacterized protein n=1 Tax=Trypanosoma rangeli TaxID=5698 RepID=A0A422MPS4_TRYRA|nr:uncharacterized protein TraAM80_10335 [Trypanosoma rangeli]RNE95221.1 hypothetical protein TraAM80_10335 [Trypanosoma rangeli]|eukprot:RNE95221.1 hypothetical protein TraAM80_10335 [Trypanosoma rangeli]